MLQGFTPEPFASDSQLEWVSMNPWRGCLADSASVGEWTPFLRGTAPASTCWPDSLYQYEYTDSVSYEPDSTYLDPDTTWSEAAEPDTALADTSEVRRPE
jgi:hypothetical protein